MSDAQSTNAVCLPDAICKLLESALSEVRLHAPRRSSGLRPGSLSDEPDVAEHEDELVSVKVMQGFLPARTSENLFPYVLVRPVSWTVEDGSTTASVEIHVGTSAPDGDDQGYRDAANVSRRIIGAFMALPGGILDERFVLNAPITWALKADDPPFSGAVITSRWDIPGEQFPF